MNKLDGWSRKSDFSTPIERPGLEEVIFAVEHKNTLKQFWAPYDPVIETSQVFMQMIAHQPLKTNKEILLSDEHPNNILSLLRFLASSYDFMGENGTRQGTEKFNSNFIK